MWWTKSNYRNGKQTTGVNLYQVEKKNLESTNCILIPNRMINRHFVNALVQIRYARSRSVVQFQSWLTLRLRLSNAGAFKKFSSRSLLAWKVLRLHSLSKSVSCSLPSGGSVLRLATRSRVQVARWVALLLRLLQKTISFL